MARVLGCLATAFVVSLALGCGTQPIPQTAVAGTTIAIPIPNGFVPGFGRRLDQYPEDPPGVLLSFPYDPDLDDPQRGELVFLLYDSQHTDPPRFLKINYITRVAMHESTDASYGEKSKYRPGQVLAFVDLPPDLATDSYTIEVERWRRADGSDEFEQMPLTILPSGGGDPVDWLGWGGAGPSSGIPISIVAQPAQQDLTFVPRAWEKFFFGQYSVENQLMNELANFVPHPSFSFYALEEGMEQLNAAAYEVELQYPRALMRVRGVRLDRNHPSGALVTWSIDPPETEGAVACDVAPGLATLRIQVVDPDELSRRVFVAYELRNYDDTCGRRIAMTDIVYDPADLIAFDVDGDEIIAIGGLDPKDFD